MADQIPDEGISFLDMENAKYNVNAARPGAWDYQNAGARDHDQVMLTKIKAQHEKDRHE